MKPFEFTWLTFKSMTHELVISKPKVTLGIFKLIPLDDVLQKRSHSTVFENTQVARPPHTLVIVESFY